MRNIKQIIFSLLDTVIKVVIIAFAVSMIYRYTLQAYDYGYRVFAEPPVSAGEGRTISIEVKQGENVKSLGEDLQQKGLIRDGRLFYFQELLSEYHGMIHPGIYDLSTSMTVDEMLQVMSSDDEEAMESEEEMYVPEVGTVEDDSEDEMQDMEMDLQEDDAEASEE